MNLTTALRTRAESVDRFKVPWWTRGAVSYTHLTLPTTPYV